MAARKKAKAKAKRKKVPARKAVARRKPARAAKKRPSKKPVVRRAAPKQPAARPAAVAAARPVSPAPPPAKPAAPAPAAPPAAPLAGEERVGVVTHYFNHLSVAVVRLESGSLRVGDTIHIWGHTSDFRQRVGSLQIEHQSVPEVTAGQEFGLKVTEHAREHDVVYKVAAS